MFTSVKFTIFLPSGVYPEGWKHRGLGRGVKKYNNAIPLISYGFWSADNEN